jgi:hypothetical protein
MMDVYLAKAAEFDALARRFDEPSVKKRYMDMADAYRPSGGRTQEAYRRQKLG